MRRLAVLIALGAATPALAQPQSDDPRFCPQRPSLGASACTTRPGEVQVELSALDWELDRTADARTDTFVIGDAVLRFGVGPTTELQLGWTPLGVVRTRDRLTGARSRGTAVGDVTLGVRQNLRNPGGDGLSYGVQPFVTIPVGRTPLGAGDWGAGMLVPVTYDLSDSVNLQFTGEVDAAVDEDGSGRHLAYSGIVGLAKDLGEDFTLDGELMLARDDDPAAHVTQAVVAGSVAWHPAKTWQLDALAVAGLNRNTPDVRLVVGGAFLLGRRGR